MIMASKNPYGKTVAQPYKENAHMVWTNGAGWTWYVLKTYQTPEREAANPHALWFCLVTSPMVGESGELGDVYVSEIKSNARRIR